MKQILQEDEYTDFLENKNLDEHKVTQEDIFKRYDDRIMLRR